MYSRYADPSAVIDNRLACGGLSDYMDGLAEILQEEREKEAMIRAVLRGLCR